MNTNQGLLATFLLLTAISPISQAAMSCLDAQNKPRTLVGGCKEFKDENSCKAGLRIPLGVNITLGTPMNLLGCQWQGNECRKDPSTSPKTVACTINRTCSIATEGTYTLVNDCKNPSPSVGCVNSAVPASIQTAVQARKGATISVTPCEGNCGPSARSNSPCIMLD